ncbi:DNA polymerase III subunit gamma and tau [Arthrobacter sp. LAPM80]|uniref:DNA polymerase III subunit gamma and tau n=1 Tax=Arthrobacter sp. LAPM80 TaxID=3141788 RepID=UPI00398A741F
MSAPTALYRRYRPDSFADVIGQEHVTAPLMTALDKNRVNHAYLFSGPRGCGKTTSARILARCLNCAKGPTSHPCGECDSCVELARGGSGSLDVIEIDAASHGGVDDARDLRERATFAPIRDRYKIFIIDEAHMVTSAGFNALLKIVEEPPEHIKFIFATTEPDKVIGTIRSRTHHYPFRLVPPEPLMAYLALLCDREGVAVAPGVLSLVVRAGGGSVRDSLSVLDQLMAGAAASGLDYDLAVDLLGYTHASLLDDVVEALAAGDSATVFKSVDRVIQTGHDPRRFVEDLLERFRDLIIVQAMPESAHAILRGTPDELIARMQTQAAQLGAAELSRAADVTNAAFNEMTGATSPRLHLELLGARLLLPGAESSTRAMATRLDQLERRLNYGGAPAAPSGNAPAPASTQGNMPAPGPGNLPEQGFPAPRTTAAPADAGSGGGIAAVRAQLARAKEAAGAEVAARHAAPQQEALAPVGTPAPGQAAPSAPAAAQVPTQAARTWDDLPTPAASPDFPAQQQAPDAIHQLATSRAHQPEGAQQDQQPTVQPAAPAPAQGGSTGIEVIRRAWPEILGALRNIRMASWVIVNQNVVPQTFDGTELRVGLPSSGLISTFSNSGHLENLQQAINQVLGMTVQILPADGEAPSRRASAEPNPKVQTGSPSPQREGGGANAPQAAGGTSPLGTSPLGQSAAVPDRAEAPTTPTQDVPAQAPAAAALDSWGLPAEQPEASPAVPTAGGAAASVQSSAPTASLAPVDTVATQMPAAVPAPETPDSRQRFTQPPAPQAQAAQAQAAQPQAAQQPVATAPAPESVQQPWDGPTEPSDPWDEPHPDSYPPADYPPADYPPADYPPADSGAAATPAPAYTPPKVSPISAWTTGWDTPVAEPVAPAPAEPEIPRRSTMLAEQIAQRSSRQPNEPAPQDWGVSLGQTQRSDVADPGWGSMSTAPDWAQGTDSTPADPAAAQQAAEHGAEAPATDAGTPKFNAALPVDGSPLGASSTYPTVPTVTTPLAQVRAQQQEDPASDMATEPATGTEKLSRYQRLANSSEAQAGRAKAPALAAATAYVEDVPSPDDVTIEESGVVGQAAVERILGGVLIEERPLNPSN